MTDTPGSAGEGRSLPAESSSQSSGDGSPDWAAVPPSGPPAGGGSVGQQPLPPSPYAPTGSGSPCAPPGSSSTQGPLPPPPGPYGPPPGGPGAPGGPPGGGIGYPRERPDFEPPPQWAQPGPAMPGGPPRGIPFGSRMDAEPPRRRSPGVLIAIIA